MPNPEPDFLVQLQTLSDHGVDFIVVGGVCAVLQGAPIATFDLDIVPAQSPENLTRLLASLQDLDAYYREHPVKKLRPALRHLSSPGHHLLMTRAGPLDILGTIAEDLGFQELKKHSVKRKIHQGLSVRFLTLDFLIQVKEKTAREKDRATLAILRRTLEEKKNQEKKRK